MLLATEIVQSANDVHKKSLKSLEVIIQTQFRRTGVPKLTPQNKSKLCLTNIFVVWARFLADKFKNDKSGPMTFAYTSAIVLQNQFF